MTADHESPKERLEYCLRNPMADPDHVVMAMGEALARIEALEGDVASWKLSASMLSRQCAEAQGKIATLEAENRRLRDGWAADEDENAIIMQECNATEAENKALSAEVFRLRERGNDWERRYLTCHKRMAAQSRKGTEYRSTIAELEAENRSAIEANRILAERDSAFQATIAKLAEENRQLREQNAKAMEIIDAGSHPGDDQ